MPKKLKKSLKGKNAAAYIYSVLKGRKVKKGKPKNKAIAKPK